MPPRHPLVVKSLSPNDLPILPFLAPRVFSPWPRSFRGRRTFAVAQAELWKSRIEDAGIIPSVTVDNGFDGIATGSLRAPDADKEARERNIPILNHKSFKTIKPRQTLLHSKVFDADKEYTFTNTEDVSRRAYQRTSGPDRPEERFPDGRINKGQLNAMNFDGFVKFKNKGLDKQDRRPREMTTLQEPRTTRIRDPTKAARLQHEARQRWLAYRSMRFAANRAIPPVRTKYERLAGYGGSALNTASAGWSTDFAKLSRKFDRQLYGQRVPRTLRVRIARQVQGRRSFVESLAKASCKSFTQEWQDLSLTQRNNLWPEIMLIILHTDPKLALKFLVATCFKPYPPSYAISDSLEYIICYYLYEVDKPDPENINILFDTIMQLLNHVDKGYIHLTQKTIFWLIKHISTDQVVQLYTVLVRSGQPIHENTLLHFIDVFARKGWTYLAIEALRGLHENGADFSRPQVESVCATLLQRRHRNSSDNMLSDSEIFALMLDLGLQPNIIFYNILLQNALEAGDPDTAWQIHNMMLENGINPDAITYSILLNDAKLRMDRATIERVLQVVRTKQIRSEYLVTDLLHAIFLLHEQDQKDRAMGSPLSSPFKRMLPLYSEYFDLEPLKDLITQAHRDVVTETSIPKMSPPRQTLIVMFIALLRGFTNPISAPEWYERFRQMVLDGRPEVLTLVTSTHIYDAVIMCLGRWPGTLPLCTKVIGDMFFSYSQTQKRIKNMTDSSHSAASKKITFTHCQPSVRTWSILLKAFMDHNQPRAAEKVLTMMRSRGITPNQVTWNSLAVGYARQQDITGTVNAIERLENEGWEVNDVTMKGLQWIQNREALTQALQQKDRRRYDRLRAKAEGVERRLAADVDDVIETAQSLYDQKEPTKYRGRRPPKPLRFAPDDLPFPAKEIQPENVGSDLPGTPDDGTSQAESESIPDEYEDVNPLEKTWKRGWI
jgi:pentatricopeptide repeat protein